MFLSIVVPVRNEEKSLHRLVSEVSTVCKLHKYQYELLFIDDGSTDQSINVLNSLTKKDSHVKIFKLRSWFGKSTALSVGFAKAKGEIIITMDGDLQDDPNEIPKFVEKINNGFDLVSGWKKNRHDPLSKVIPSRTINLAVRILTGLKLHDINCGFKAYRANVVKNLNIYGDLYRFIPVFVYRKGYKVTEIEVNHRKRLYGQSKYGIRRFFSGLLDLLTIFFLSRYLKRPGHFFGGIGTLFLFFGTLIGSYITFLRFTTGGINYHYPLLFLGVLLILIGFQFIMTGLIAEMIIYYQEKDAPDKFI